MDFRVLGGRVLESPSRGLGFRVLVPSNFKGV